MKDPERIYFLTSNMGKYREAAAVAAASGLRLHMLTASKVEIQASSLQRIASYAAREAANRLEVNIVAEDAGLFVEKLHGFPGPYSSDAFKRLGTEGILKLMENISQRNAEFRSAVAFCKPCSKPRCFIGTVAGTINHNPRGTGGFGYDPIFIPVKGDGRTFAQMTVKEKNRISHRAESFRKLAQWLRKA